jgi:putative CocE/NonD family hydrolase
MPTSISTEMNVPIEMRDGSVLRADIYRPNDQQKYPAILIRSYDKNRVGRLFAGSLIDLFDLIGAGYAFITQDMRGRGASEGEWTPEAMTKVEGRDGYDTVEWVAGQSWCDGNVGMLGYSHASRCAWLAAMENPPHLKAIAPWSFGAPVGRRWTVPPISSGVVSLILSLSWLTNEAPDVVNRLERAGQDVSEMRRALTWATNHPDEAFSYLPLNDMPFVRFERVRQLWKSQLSPQAKAGVGGSEGDTAYRDAFKEVMLPCSFQCGWHDGNGWATTETFRNMREVSSRSIRDNQYILMGPWPHGRTTPALAGINYGPSAQGPSGKPIVSEYLFNFFDRYLKGKDITMPSVRYFVMGKNQWQEADMWPLPQTQWQRFFLHSKGNANTRCGNGELNRDEPSLEPADRFIYDPHNPVPTVGGRIISAPAGFGFVAGPLEQSAIDRRSDVLCYTSSELKDDVEVTGPLEIHVFAATSAKDTDFTAKFIDVYPDGRSHNIAEGIKRASSIAKVINPGEAYEYVIGLGNTSQLFRKGHRIRIDISSSNFPLYDRNMNTGNPIGIDAQGIPAIQTIYHQSGYASYIDLPVIPDKS